ncbi:hypothetical protein TTHERM_01154660 (macronuclear) [Tetrahymena thermophila SB210]|uniref:Oxalate/formate antiporter protein n=1 Tax=Tetrahymena thermophila (strain SB210) TaxID=312017 RepID=Q232S6_TETTS|nr:hypothetical protein TTHERM_01154660 [Tetrahymena thermophila SB210]EAR91528.2 hypothetical protein TTHERM_01154660 [Tetrahymena thermophila SB210]|eukprot:XP_001011773.2 hypothetical protein TTHERM_01154660 [Tetrahymena thermophila SB210]
MLASHLYSRSSVQNGASSLPPIRFGPSLLPRRPLVTFTFLHGIFRNKGGGIGFEPPISLLRPSDSPTRAAQPFFQIGDEGVLGIGSCISMCTNLSSLTLDLFFNKVGIIGASSLGSALKNCTNLQTLTLALNQNKIGDEGTLFLGSALAQCTNLSNLTLNLSRNQISAICASGLGSALAKCANLSNLALNLSKNEINGSEEFKVNSKLFKSKRLVAFKIYFQL